MPDDVLPPETAARLLGRPRRRQPALADEAHDADRADRRRGLRHDDPSRSHRRRWARQSTTVLAGPSRSVFRRSATGIGAPLDAWLDLERRLRGVARAPGRTAVGASTTRTGSGSPWRRNHEFGSRRAGRRDRSRRVRGGCCRSLSRRRRPRLLGRSMRSRRGWSSARGRAGRARGAACGDRRILPEAIAASQARLFGGKVEVAPYEGSYEEDPFRQARQMSDVAVVPGVRRRGARPCARAARPCGLRARVPRVPRSTPARGRGRGAPRRGRALPRSGGGVPPRACGPLAADVLPFRREGGLR